jgi:hypothetical protein
MVVLTPGLDDRGGKCPSVLWKVGLVSRIYSQGVRRGIGLRGCRVDLDMTWVNRPFRRGATPMSRPALKRLTRPRCAQLGPGLLALGLAAASFGCSDSTPRAESVEPAALRKAVEERRSVTFNRGSKTGNVSTTRLRAKGKPSPPVEPSVKTPVKTR